jgi:type I restriction enzyme R subunit
MHDTQPLDRKRNVSLEKLMEAVAFGKRDQDILSAIASRLARLDNQLTKEDRAALTAVANGQPLADITRKIVAAVDPDGQIEAAKKQYAVEEPTPEQITQVTKALLDEAARPIAHNPPLRNRILAIKKSYEQIIDNISQDQLVFAGADPQNKDRAMTLVKSFEQFIEKHKDEIEALQILYSRPYAERLTYKQVKELADAIQKPSDGMRAVTPEQLWHAYETLDNSKVHGGGGKILADIVNIVRFAVRQRDELVPREEDVKLRFDKWVQEQQSNSRRFTDEQRQWLEAIRDHMITALTIEPEDFDFVPFAQKGGLGKAYQVFGERLQPLLNELNEVLAA